MDVWYNYDEHFPGVAPHTLASEHSLTQQQKSQFHRPIHQVDYPMQLHQGGYNHWHSPGAAHDSMSSHYPGPADDCLEVAHSLNREHLEGNAAESMPGRFPHSDEVGHPHGRFSDFGTVPIRVAGHGPAQLSWDGVPTGLQQPSPSPTAPPFLPTIMERTASRRSIGASSASSHRYSHTGNAPQFGHHASSSPAMLPAPASAHGLYSNSYHSGASQSAPPPFSGGMPPSGRWSFSGSDIQCAAAPKHDIPPCRQPADHMASGPPSHMMGHIVKPNNQRDSRTGQVSDMARCASLLH